MAYHPWHHAASYDNALRSIHYGRDRYEVPDGAFSLVTFLTARSVAQDLSQSYRASRPLEDSDLARLRHYAPRVKGILQPYKCVPDSSYLNRTSIASSVFEALKNYLSRANGHLLPNLLAYEVSVERTGFDAVVPHQYLCVFLTTNVKHVSLHFGNSSLQMKETGLARAIAELDRRTPQLRSLHIEYQSSESLHAPEVLTEHILSFHQLTAFVTDTLTVFPRALFHLAQLPELRVLKLPLQDDDITAVQSSDRSDLFPALRELHLTNERSLSHCLALLERVGSPYLSSVGLEIRNEPWTIDGVMGAINALSSRTHKERLVSIRICSGPCGGHLDVALTSDMFEPLLSLPALSDVVISVNCHYDIDDGTLHAMARAWPGLRRLELGFDHWERNDHEPQASLASLASLAQACPHLEVLRIGVDASVLPPPQPPHPAPRPAPHPLHQLRVGWSPIHDPVAVAGFLSDTFPRLRRVQSAWLVAEDFDDGPEGFWEEHEAPRMMWEEVSYDLLPGFAFVREQERNWLRGRAQRAGHVSG